MSESLSSRRPHGNGTSSEGFGPTPTGKLTGKIWSRLRALFGSREHENPLRETLEELIDEQDSEPTEIDDDARILIGNILKLHDVTVHDVMVPRADIVAVEIGMAFPGLVNLISAEGHSRIRSIVKLWMTCVEWSISRTFWPGAESPETDSDSIRLCARCCSPPLPGGCWTCFWRCV